jgi:hypothetical protein
MPVWVFCTIVSQTNSQETRGHVDAPSMAIADRPRPRHVSPDTDALFQLPLSEFTAARNTLVSRLKKSGRQDDASRVKALARPPVSAWVANQLYWRHRKAFDRLLSAGDEFRRAQAAQLKGKSVDVRSPLEARRAALAELIGLATDILGSSGHQPTPGLMRRVTTTLEAVSIVNDTADAPRPGRLVEDVDPPGFEALASLVPIAGGGPRVAGKPSVLPFSPKRHGRPAASSSGRGGREEEEDEARRAAAKAALQNAERQLREARAAAERAQAALKKAAAKVKTAEDARADAERRLDRATEELSAAKQAARQVAADAEAAAEAAADAEREVGKLRL